MPKNLINFPLFSESGAWIGIASTPLFSLTRHSACVPPSSLSSLQSSLRRSRLCSPARPSARPLGTSPRRNPSRTHRLGQRAHLHRLERFRDALRTLRHGVPLRKPALHHRRRQVPRRRLQPGGSGRRRQVWRELLPVDRTPRGDPHRHRSAGILPRCGRIWRARLCRTRNDRRVSFVPLSGPR